MAKLTPITVDLETFFSVTHSLTKMSPIEYVTHPETEVISLAYKFADDRTHCIFGEDKIAAWAKTVDWSDKLVIGHNLSGFDSMILAWRFGIKPALWSCTLAMSRPWHMKDVGGSLAKLVEHYALGKKDQTALMNTKGRHLKDFSPEEIAAMREYNKTDVNQCWELFKIFLPKTPKSEMKLIDMTVRMLVEPQFELDTALLENALVGEREHKKKMLLDLATMIGAYEPGMTDEEAAEAVSKTLGSAAKFGKLLNDLGVEVPTKISPTTGKEAPALAKTDEGFIALTTCSDPIVVAAANARLGVKSTLLETRIEKFLQAGAACGGKLPVPLRYYGGHTGRWSGEQYNPQNLPRINPSKPRRTDALRASLRAPKGHKVVVADLSGIELRVNHFLWKVPASMALYQASPDKADLYKDFASKLYGVDVEDVTKDMRQIGKIAHLGLGFSAGAKTFVRIAKIMGGVDMTEEEAKLVVDSWRASYSPIVQGWRNCQNALKYAYGGNSIDIDPWGMCKTISNGIETPKGYLLYPELRQERTEARTQWLCGQGRNKTFLSGGKVDENCIAAGTLVLCERGWVPIEQVGLSDRVHDGIAFVSHDGLIVKGKQACVRIDGVHMTPDHEVLTNEGWRQAQENPRPYRPDLRRVDSSYQGSLAYWYEDPMAVQVPVRSGLGEGDHGRQERGQARGVPKLRVPDWRTYTEEEQYPRHDEAPELCGLVEYVGTLPTAVARGLGKLRRTWDNSLRSVGAFIRAVLGGYGTDVRTGVGPRSYGQQRELRADELPVGDSQGEHPEQAKLVTRGYTGNGCYARNRQVDVVLPSIARETTGRPDRETEVHEVFDIRNAGWRHRFVVLGGSGPFIVHNCVQHLARSIIADNMLIIQKEIGFAPALTVHDELVYVVPETIADDVLASVQGVMRTPPSWWPELVVWSEGDVADTYGAAK